MADDDEMPDVEAVEVDPHVAQMIAAADSQDALVELVCSYRAKLSAQDFSEAAIEEMVVAYHNHLCMG